MSEVKRYDIGGMSDGGIDVQDFKDGYWVKAEDYCELKAQRDALAGESAGLKFVQKGLVKLINEHVGDAILTGDEMKTPATAAYLNSVRAEGVERFAKHFNCADINDEILDFAAQLRAGELE